MEELAVETSAIDAKASTPGLSPAKGLLVVVAIALVVVCFLLLSNALGIVEFWAGFLFLFFWAGIEQMRFERLNQAVAGASVGLLAAFALNQLPQLLGSAGFILALGCIVLLVYCQVMGWLTLAVNNATILFLTVATIPHLQANGNFGHMFAALFLGMVFFGGLLWCASLAMKRKAKNPG